MPKNLGQKYETTIQNILRNRNLLPKLLKGNDAGFKHHGVRYFIEVKNVNAPDYGQKGLTWSEAAGWKWRKKDAITDFYDALGVTNYIDPNFKPRRYTVKKENITFQDKQFDQLNFEKSGIPLAGADCLFDYYAKKECYYIQVEGLGFYYMKRDIANLVVPQFTPTLTLRLRAKTHHSNPHHAYSFFAVINAHTNAVYQSMYDLEEAVGEFPPFV